MKDLEEEKAAREAGDWRRLRELGIQRDADGNYATGAILAAEADDLEREELTRAVELSPEQADRLTVLREAFAADEVAPHP
jgi:hypothetical protein